MVILQEVKVSVCISIYNGEQFIRNCLDSVVCQTLKEIEIVLVNNGSTDLSLEIMNEYKKKYPNIIRVYSQEDKGLAQGRQTGIDNARGQFVTFLDADDFVSEDAYEKMYDSAVKHNVDIVECMTLRDNKIIHSKYEGVKRTSEILKDYFLNGDIPSMIWLRLYNRSLFVNPVMPNMYVNNEDIFAFPCLLHIAKNIYYLKEQLHNYSIDNEHSVMIEVKNKKINEEKIIKNRIKTLHVVNHIRNFIGIKYIDKNYSKEFNAFTARTVLNFCMNEFKSLSVDDSIKIASEKTEINLNVLNSTFKKLKHYNKFIQKSVNYLGFKKTVFLYRTTKGLFSSLKG
jgi:glycosyltransferase involved in cell wall biosynthesis